MALDVYYPDDIRRILEALASAGAANGPEYHKALCDIALAFGVRPPQPVDNGWRVVRSNGQPVEVLALDRGR